ncbi:MAG: FkbM family methyltransferase, partial [Alphaproteobacteria bacterium]|nr:FkbM family methyltransferase [Alphaproteobacteria bacterium]
ARDSSWIVAPRTAIGETEGEILLNISEETSMSSALDANPALLEALPRTANQEKVSTPVRRLDSLWNQYVGPDKRAFLKVDTQGFERQVLNGATESLKKLQGVQMELSLFELYQGEETYLGFLQDLHRWGFAPYMIWETYFSRKLKRQLQIDVVFMRD